MTVAISCNLSDGVILGVDSTVSLPSQDGILKVYENAEKLFQLGDRPIGIAMYGLGALGVRSIGSYVREFEVSDPGGVGPHVDDGPCRGAPRLLLDEVPARGRPHP